MQSDPARRDVWISLLLLVVGLLLVCLIGLVRRAAWLPWTGSEPNVALSATIPEKAAAPASTFDHLPGAVRLTVYDAAGGIVEGTGALLTEDGFLLSSYHVVADTAGQLRNPGGIAWVGLAAGAGEAPADDYLARVRAFDHFLDIALLQIIATPDGSPVTLPLELTPIPVGDSAGLSPGDELVLLWFPSSGSAPARTTSMRVAEVSERWVELEGSVDSTGSALALNLQGRLVGIEVSAGTEAATTGRRVHIVPIHLVNRWLDLPSTGGSICCSPSGSGAWPPAANRAKDAPGDTPRHHEPGHAEYKPEEHEARNGIALDYPGDAESREKRDQHQHHTKDE